jgi:Ca-activated chloride channel family protein
MAADLLRRTGLSRGEILLVTDSATSRDAARARGLREDGVLTSVLAVGTPDGAPIPSGGGFVSDRAGNVVIARMDRSALRAVADAGGGRYTELAAAAPASDLWLDHDGSEFARRDDAVGERWKDAGPWLVLLLLPLALAGFRRGLLFAMPVLMLNGLLVPREAAANWWDDLWLRKDQQAYQALADEDPERAAALAEDPALAGESWYRSGEYENAQQSWSEGSTADAHYNRGNALALQGELDAALAAYDEALALQPGMPDAEYNRALVESLKQQQEQQQQQQGEQGESGDADSQSEQQEGEDAQQSEGEEGQEGEQSAEQDAEQQGEPSEEEADGQEAETGTELAEAWSEEDAQAMEQWLRRIPDDPGGLLRRKFRSQHQSRGAPDDEREAW